MSVTKWSIGSGLKTGIFDGRLISNASLHRPGKGASFAHLSVALTQNQAAYFPGCARIAPLLSTYGSPAHSNLRNHAHRQHHSLNDRLLLPYNTAFGLLLIERCCLAEHSTSNKVTAWGDTMSDACLAYQRSLALLATSCAQELWPSTAWFLAPEPKSPFSKCIETRQHHIASPGTYAHLVRLLAGI